MATLKSLALAINQKLTEVFPEIPITNKDITEGFARPSFYTDFDSFRVLQTSGRRTDKTVHVTIYFFPTDRYQYKLELLDVQEELQAAFCDELVLADGTRLYMGELESEVVDGVLQFAFDIAFTQYADPELSDSDAPYMQELNYKG